MSRHIQLAIQPAYSIKTSKIMYAEVLIRGYNGIDNVGRIISEACKYGWTERLDLDIIRETLSIISKLPKVPKYPIAINVCADTILNVGVADKVLDIIGEFNIKNLDIVIEISEYSYFTNQTVIDNIEKLHSNGIKIAIDDFGVENANLNCLMFNELDILKIDKSLVDEIIHKNKKASKILKCTLAICKELKLEHIVEGIEQYDQLEEIKELGFRNIQGYVMAKPVLIEHFKF